MDVHGPEGKKRREKLHFFSVFCEPGTVQNAYVSHSLNLSWDQSFHTQCPAHGHRTLWKWSQGLMPSSPQLQSPHPFPKPDCLPDCSSEEENIPRFLSGLGVRICWRESPSRGNSSEVSYEHHALPGLWYPGCRCTGQGLGRWKMLAKREGIRHPDSEWGCGSMQLFQAPHASRRPHHLATHWPGSLVCPRAGRRVSV